MLNELRDEAGGGGAESAESVPCTAWTPQPFPAVQEVFRTWWLKPQALYRCQENVSGNFQDIA